MPAGRHPCELDTNIHLHGGAVRAFLTEQPLLGFSHKCNGLSMSSLYIAIQCLGTCL